MVFYMTLVEFLSKSNCYICYGSACTSVLYSPENEFYHGRKTNLKMVQDRMRDIRRTYLSLSSCLHNIKKSTPLNKLFRCHWTCWTRGIKIHTKNTVLFIGAKVFARLSSLAFLKMRICIQTIKWQIMTDLLRVRLPVLK